MHTKCGCGGGEWLRLAHWHGPGRQGILTKTSAAGTNTPSRQAATKTSEGVGSNQCRAGVAVGVAPVTCVPEVAAGVAPVPYVPDVAVGVAPVTGSPEVAVDVAPVLYGADIAGSFQSGMANGPNSAVRSPCAQGEEA